MRALTKTEIKTKAELLLEMTDAATAYNAARDAFNQWREQIVERMDEYEGERSERWQESEAGETFQAWREAWDQEIGDEVDEAIAENADGELPDSLGEV